MPAASSSVFGGSVVDCFASAPFSIYVAVFAVKPAVSATSSHSRRQPAPYPGESANGRADIRSFDGPPTEG
jgi:hypothetical protein